MNKSLKKEICLYCTLKVSILLIERTDGGKLFHSIGAATMKD